MLSRRSIHSAAVVFAGCSAVATAARSFSTGSSQVWIVLSGDAAHPCANGIPWTLRVPLDVSFHTSAVSTPSKTASAHTGHGVLRRSRTLLAPLHSPSPPPAGSSTATASKAEETEELRSPYDVTIDEALLGSSNLHSSSTTTSVRDLVRLLVDPDAGTAVEAVSLRDFAAMAPKRQLRAVNNDHDCLDVLLNSERYQSEKDARTLRLHGITTVGQWREQPDRVPLSAYGRGVLEATYHRHARGQQQSQKDLVVAWLTRTIQRAVAEELMAPRQLPAGSGAPVYAQPSLVSATATVAAAADVAQKAAGDIAESTEEAAVAYTTTFGMPEEQAQTAKPSKATEAAMAEEEEEVVEEEEEAAPRRRGPRQRPAVPQVSKAQAKAAAAAEEQVDEEAVEEVLKEVSAEQGEEVDAKMAEAEAILKKDGPLPPVSAAAAATTTATAVSASKAGAAAVKGSEDATAPSAEEEEEEEVEEVVEEVEDEEAEAEAAATPKATPTASATPPAAVNAAAPLPASAAVSTSSGQQKEKLARLAELMLKQFNTADGYLHPTNKAARAEQEQRGDILVLDEDTAQVNPLTMFSAYHAATVTEADPIAVRALKTIWTSYNKHQMALEEASTEAAAEFYKHESVNALLYGSVLMRALAREEPVMVLEGTSLLPPYGFPLVSSDTRPFSAAATSSSSPSVTDMTPGKVLTAMQAYKVFFSDKEKRYSPFRPAIDRNANCSVVRLSGTTLHLYYTSTNDHVVEEEVRMPFAEVMLGMLHLLRQKVLPRVNVVHYHLIATRVADTAADADFLLRSTATLDLTLPFTKEEHTRLKALAAPLGMSDEVEEFGCIDDVVMEIEDNSGASVVHSLLHNREDLEATLTATLAQLLPEDVERGAESADGEEDNEDMVEVEEEAEEEEEELAAPRGRAHAAKKPPHHPAPPVAPTTRRSAAAAAKDDVDDEEAKLEEAIYTQWQKQKEQQQQRGSAATRVSTTARTIAAPQAVADEDTEEVEEEIVEEEEFEEEEEEQAGEAASSPSPAVGATTSGTTARMTRSAAYSHHTASASTAAKSAAAASPARRTAAPPPPSSPADEEEEEEMEVVTAPVLPRRPAGHRAVPVEVDDEEVEEEVVAPRSPPSPPPPQQQQQQHLQHHRAARHAPSATHTAASPAPVRARAASSPPVTASAAPAEDAEVEEEEEEEAPPLPQVRTRRSAARRHAARSRVPTSLEEEEAHGAAFHGDDSAAGNDVDETVANEDQWFKKRPKRRHF